MQSSLELHVGAPVQAQRWLHTGHCGCSLGKEKPAVPCGLPALGAARHEMRVVPVRDSGKRPRSQQSPLPPFESYFHIHKPYHSPQAAVQCKQLRKSSTKQRQILKPLGNH